MLMAGIMVMIRPRSSSGSRPPVFLAAPVIASGPARGDTEIEKYFDMSVVLIPVDEALRAVGATITSMETVGALMAARAELQ